MKLIKLRIKNYRVCRDVSLDLGNLHALIGGNNTGKSTVLRALDFFFNPSVRTLDKESFWNLDIASEIRVEGTFTDLTEYEKEKLGPYLKDDGTFHMARTAKMITEAEGIVGEPDRGETEIKISQQYEKPIPEPQWLQEKKVSQSNIDKWWRDREQLTVNGINFTKFLNSSQKPSSKDWKQKSKEFVATYAEQIPMIYKWVDNPQGYANVLKGTLPFFVYVPAVREVAEEVKGTKSSPFGKLLSTILDTVSDEKKAELGCLLSQISEQVNRSNSDLRIPKITEVENLLNVLLRDLFQECDLEIEFKIPTLEALISSPKLYVDDGFRTGVENKGHGLQRAVIFSIRRRYAAYRTSEPEGRKRNFILAVEEPELYMHPHAQRTIRRVFRTISENGDQVLFSTHSPLLVDVAHFDEIIRFDSAYVHHKDKKTRECNAWQLSMCQLEEVILQCYPEFNNTETPQSIRERVSNTYNSKRNEGFFASKIILVEGQTEEYCLPIYADALIDGGFDGRCISVIECGGKAGI